MRGGGLGGQPVNAIAVGRLRRSEIGITSIRKIASKNTHMNIFAISTLHINNAVFDFQRNRKPFEIAVIDALHPYGKLIAGSCNTAAPYGNMTIRNHIA